MKPSPPITIIKLHFVIEKILILFSKKDLIFFDNLFLSETIVGLIIFNGALGQTRTGTPKRARILSPLCLPISPRGH